MTINASKLSLAVLLATFVAWTLCSLAVAVFPALSMTVMGHMLHMPTNVFDWSLTWSGFAMGAILWSGFAALFTWLAAVTYNSMLRAPAAAGTPLEA